MGHTSKTERRRGSNSSLANSPWQVSAVLAASTYVGLKWVLPGFEIGNPVFKAIAGALAPQAGLFAGVLFFISLIAYAKSRARQNRRQSEFGSAATVDPVWSPRSTPGRREPRPAVKFTTPAKAAPLPAAAKSAASKSVTPKPTDWSLELIRDIEWKRFEDVCQQFYESKGIRSETTALGPDGGIDIRLFQDDSGKATSIVQCKAWGERYVGVKPVRELLGVMTHEKIVKAFFMTSGKYSDEAKDFAKVNRIILIDGEMFLMMINRLSESARGKLLAFATAGDYRTPSCPSCGVKMRAVKGRGGKPDFWGCRRFPGCKQRLGMRGAG